MLEVSAKTVLLLVTVVAFAVLIRINYMQDEIDNVQLMNQELTRYVSGVLKSNSANTPAMLENLGLNRTCSTKKGGIVVCTPDDNSTSTPQDPNASTQ